MIDNHSLPDISDYPEIKFGKRVIDVRELLTIDPENLVEDYRTIHHWIAVSATKVSNYNITISQRKRELARLEARLSRSGRQTEKKVTEAALKNYVTLDPGFAKAQDEIAGLEATRNRYSILLSALENKRDMVINMGAELRKRKIRDSVE